MEKYPFYDIVLFIAILSNVLFMSIAIIIIRTKKTARKNSQILHKVMQLPVDEEKERSYTIKIIFIFSKNKIPCGFSYVNNILVENLHIF